MREYRLYLEDILKSAAKIQQYTKDMELDDFVVDERAFDTVIRKVPPLIE